MKIERLLNPDLNIDLEHDGVYFGGSSSPNSFSGHLGDVLEEEQVLEYIRRNNWALFDRLWGLQAGGHLNSVTSAVVNPHYLSDGAAAGLGASGDTARHESELLGAARASGKLWALRSTSVAPVMWRPSRSNLDPGSVDFRTTRSNIDPASSLAELASPSTNELHKEVDFSRQKGSFQSLSLSDRSIVLQKTPPADVTVGFRCCYHALCRYRHGMPPEIDQLKLEPKSIFQKPPATMDKSSIPTYEDSGQDLRLRLANNGGVCCLECNKDLFSGVTMLDDDSSRPSTALQASSLLPGLTSPPMAFDGSRDGNLELRPIILQMAENLLPHVQLANESRVRIPADRATDLLEHSISDPLTEVPANDDLGTSLARQMPSNSDEAILLRNAKCQETQITLRLLRKVACRQEARRLSPSLGDVEFQNLRILRPVDLPPHKERYKKQGLGRKDWRLWRASLLAPRLEDSNTPSPTAMERERERTENHRIVAPIQRFCSCREREGREVMVLCSAKLCLIGWFHVRCSGLSRLPTKAETWFCTECSTIFGPGTFNPTLELTSAQNAVCNRVLRSDIKGASKVADGYASRSAPADEFSTDETGLLFSDDEIMDPTYNLPATPRRQSKSADGRNSTPYAFLDGADDKKSDFQSAMNIEDTRMSNTRAPTMLLSEDESKATNTESAMVSGAPFLPCKVPANLGKRGYH